LADGPVTVDNDGEKFQVNIDAVDLLSGQRVPTNAKEGGDVGVVCHLSLNTKVGKLETETKRLKR